MQQSSNILPVMLKSSLVATILFWISVCFINSDFDSFVLVLLFISIIPISIVCSLAILFTIVPLFLLEEKDISSDIIFRKYFPYHSIAIFSISTYFMITTNFDELVTCFFISAFFTLIQSWIWLCKPNKKLVSS